MSLFCRMGLHRWSFSSELVNEPGHRTHTEIIHARCRRHGCARYGAWSLVHREAHVRGTTRNDSPVSLALVGRAKRYPASDLRRVTSHTAEQPLCEDGRTTTTVPISLAIRRVDSPHGPLTIAGSTEGLRAILWPDDDPARAGIAGIPLRQGSVDALDEAAHQLEEYFGGTRTTFDLSLDVRGTAFQIAAWQALAEIPYGETRSYAEQAARLGRPAAVRAVGAANGRNPLSIVLPCHRVIGSDGTLRGFPGGLDVKAALLAFERAHGTPD